MVMPGLARGHQEMSPPHRGGGTEQPVQFSRNPAFPAAVLALTLRLPPYLRAPHFLQCTPVRLH